MPFSEITFWMMEEEIRARGHPNVTGTHRTTLEITRDEEISLRADCVIGVMADKAVKHLNPLLKEHLLKGGEIEVLISVGGEVFPFRARGSPRLTLSSEKEIVFRKSNYVDDRTIAIKSTAAAIDVPRSMIKMLRNEEDLIVKIRALKLP